MPCIGEQLLTVYNLPRTYIGPSSVIFKEAMFLDSCGLFLNTVH